jgi:aminopeptidase N
VVLDRKVPAEERAFLLAHDTDPFNRWEAGRALAKDVLAAMITEGAAPGPAWLDAMAAVARDDSLDPAFRALCLRLPGEDDMAQTLADAGHVPDPDAIFAAREALRRALAQRLSGDLPALYAAFAQPGPYSPDARSAGARALRNACLGLMARLDGGARAAQHYAEAANMTDSLAALGALIEVGRGEEELAAFHRRWAGDRLVIDKWFALQVGHAPPDRAAGVARALTGHRDFAWKTPNRFRAVLGTLGAHHGGFHAASGAGYDLLADWLIRLDPVNPQTAARMTTAYETWRRYDAGRQAKARAAMERILAVPGVSRDTGEMVSRLLGDRA